MKKTITEQHASGPVPFLVLLAGAVTACTAPIEPTAPAAPSARIASAAPGRIAATFSRSITIDYTLVPNTDQENFPVLISGTYDGTGGTPDLRTTGNGGKVQSASGYDVGFYTNSSCSKGKMRWETEKYTAQTGEVVYWVKVPTVSHSSVTVFYICYGNSSITTDQSSAALVWDPAYRAVWHLADNGGLVLSNSEGHGPDLTNPGPVSTAAGKIGGGTNKFVDNTYFLANASLSIEADKAVTISMWKKLLAADNDVEGNHITFGLGAEHATPTSMTLWAPYFGTAYWYYGDGGPSVDYSGYYDRWVYITCVYNPAASKLEALYLDGNLVASSTNGSTMTGTATGFRIGQSVDAHGQDPSQFDEVRISTSARSSDWIKTEFNNQNNPASFYAIGAETQPN